MVAPVGEVLKLFSLRESPFLSKPNLGIVFIRWIEHALGHDGSAVEDSGESGAEEVALFADEVGVGVNLGVEITAEDMLD